jgi:hypothetical protein
LLLQRYKKPQFWCCCKLKGSKMIKTIRTKGACLCLCHSIRLLQMHCIFFQRGYCKYGDSCRFEHSLVGSALFMAAFGDCSLHLLDCHLKFLPTWCPETQFKECWTHNRCPDLSQ